MHTFTANNANTSFNLLVPDDGFMMRPKRCDIIPFIFIIKEK